jgi:hypothetical protein
MGVVEEPVLTTAKNMAFSHTVGAHSIAHGHIGDNICKKRNIRKTILNKELKGSIQQQNLEQKNACLAIKGEYYHVPKK